MSLKELLDDKGVGIAEIGAWLDGLDHDARKAAAFTLDRAGQRALYERAAKGPAITLEHFVPDGVADRTEVIHHGRNTLPLPAGQKLFQKRFCRPGEGDAARGSGMYGYNEAPTRGLIGPGYFVAIETAGKPEWEVRGAIVVDYFQVPEGPVVDGWPDVVPNSRGLQFFVYNKTRDFMRRVSQHVSIGAAYKKEKALGHFFILVREDA
jgi:hypothetical protein